MRDYFWKHGTRKVATFDTLSFVPERKKDFYRKGGNDKLCRKNTVMNEDIVLPLLDRIYDKKVYLTDEEIEQYVVPFTGKRYPSKFVPGKNDAKYLLVRISSD